VFSVIVPVPPAVRDLARELRPALTGFDRIRPARSRRLVLKRLPADDRREYLEAARRAKRVLAETAPFEVRITGTGVFRDPPRGPAPVAYLAVESEGLQRAHERLVEEFDAVAGLEGADYVPHLTLARGGPHDAPAALTERDVDPISFTASKLDCYDSEHTERVESIQLSA